MRNDNFKIMSDILNAIESQMDAESIDWMMFSADAQGVSQYRWARIMDILCDEGFIKGFSYTKKQGTATVIDAKNVRLTYAGLCYLRNNS
jgi:ribosomal protein S8